jgi:Xaa-Pro dipeptidase
VLETNAARRTMKDFPAAEYEARLDRVQRAMRERGFDALIVTTESNHRYITGHWTGRWYNLSRPIYSIVPTAGRPVLFTSKNEAAMASMTAWTDDIRSYWSADHNAPGALALLLEYLGETQLNSARLGLELGVSHRLGMTVNDFIGLQASLPKARLLDAAEFWWDIRAIKSDAECSVLRDACVITDLVFEELNAIIRPGITESEIASWMHQRYFQLGADRGGFVVVRADINDPLAGGAGPRPIESGNLVYIDAGCVVRGYWSDYCRYYAVGKVPEATLDAHRAQWELMQKCLEAVVPGRSWGEVYQAQQDAVRTLNLPHAGFFGRCGHAIGLDQCEHPSIHADNERIIEPGMTFCIEPNYQSLVGYFVGEEEVGVTADGYRFLNRPAAREPMRVH